MTPSEPEYRTIPLTKGQFAIVDAADYEWLSQWKWNANWIERIQTYYVMRTETLRSRRQAGQRQRTVRMHRLILGLKHGDARQVDHINGNPLDNRRGNLRIATREENLCNKRTYKNNTSGIKGVSTQGKSWRVGVSINGKRKHVGCYPTLEMARSAYNEAAIKLYGEFARTA